jgi:hypothetical protein
MATPSQVKSGLDDISDVIVAQRQTMKGLVSSAGSVGATLDGLASTYGDVIATINAYAANTTDAFELVSKAELAKMTAEFTALRANVTTVTSISL